MYQSVMVIGSFMLFSLLTVTINGAIVDKIDATYQSEAIIAATTLGQAMMQEISLKAFDDAVVLNCQGAHEQAKLERLERGVRAAVIIEPSHQTVGGVTIHVEDLPVGLERQQPVAARRSRK